jgi:hypothetical protein
MKRSFEYLLFSFPLHGIAFGTDEKSRDGSRPVRGLVIFIKAQEKIRPEKKRRVHDEIRREHEDEKKNSEQQEKVEEFETEDPVRRSDFPEPLHGIFHSSAPQKRVML